MIATRRSARTLAAVAVLAVAATACEMPFGDSGAAETESSAGDEAAPEDPPPATVEEPTTTAGVEEAEATDAVEEAAAPEWGEQAGEEAPEASDVVGDEPLATVAGSEPFPELEILDLRRDGDVVTLVFSILVGEDSGFVSARWVFAGGPDQFRMATEDGDAGANDPRGKAVSGVTLVDRDNANRHLVLRDSEGYCLCTRFEDSDAGQRYLHSAQFPAPPEGVDSMTVEVPQFPSVDNVPIRESS